MREKLREVDTTHEEQVRVYYRKRVWHLKKPKWVHCLVKRTLRTTQYVCSIRHSSCQCWALNTTATFPLLLWIQPHPTHVHFSVEQRQVQKQKHEWPTQTYTHTHTLLYSSQSDVSRIQPQGMEHGCGNTWNSCLVTPPYSIICSTSMKPRQLYVLLIGRGWPIIAPVLGPDHWLSAWWWSVKCVINPGHGPQHIRVAERPGRGFLSLGWMAKQGSQGSDGWSN